MEIINGNESSSTSTLQPAAGNLSAGAGGGDKTPRHPSSMSLVHELDSAAAVDTAATTGGTKKPFECSFCAGTYSSKEDLHCHIRRCHVHRRWRRGSSKENAPRPPASVDPVHELAGGASGSKRPADGEECKRVYCSFCERDYVSEEELSCHVRRCHVHRSWRGGNEEDAPRQAPSVAGPSLGGSVEKGCSEQKEQQLTDEAAVPPEAPAWPVFDLNVPAPEVEEEKGSSG